MPPRELQSILKFDAVEDCHEDEGNARVMEETTMARAKRESMNFKMSLLSVIIITARHLAYRFLVNFLALKIKILVILRRMKDQYTLSSVEADSTAPRAGILSDRSLLLNEP